MTGHRRLALLVISALAGAGCCAGAAAMPWWSRRFDDALAGTVDAVARGSDLLGELVPVALVALAGLGATFATRGVLRRAVGVLVSVAGALVAVRAVLAMSSAPVAALSAQLKRPATPLGPADLTVAGPLVALAGGLLIVAAGVLATTGADRARSMGSAYDSPGRRRERALERARAGADAVGEPADAGDLWRAMDAGVDPTDPAGAPAAAHAGTARAPGRLATPGAPGPEGPGRPDTMGGPEGPDDGDNGPGDDAVRHGRGHRAGPTRQAPDEETTG